MNPNWLGIPAAFLALVAFLATYRLAKKAPLKARVIWALLGMIAAIPGVSFAVHYAHLLPEASWYYQFRSIVGTEFLMVFVGVAGGLMATLLPRLLLFLPLLGVVGFSLVPISKPFIGPIHPELLQDKWEGEVCLQSTPSTCGAASTATILKQLGVNVTESEIAKEAHSYSGGTEAWYLARAARARGFDVDFIFSRGFTPEEGLPAVVGVRLNSFGHFIAVLGQEGDKYIVGDPLQGRELLSREELLLRYAFTGFHMRIRKRNDQGSS